MGTLSKQQAALEAEVRALRVVRERVERLQVWLPPRNADMISKDAVLAILDAEIGAARTPDAVVLEGMQALCEESLTPDEFARWEGLVAVLRTRRTALRDGATAALPDVGAMGIGHD